MTSTSSKGATEAQTVPTDRFFGVNPLTVDVASILNYVGTEERSIAKVSIGVAAISERGAKTVTEIADMLIDGGFHGSRGTVVNRARAGRLLLLGLPSIEEKDRRTTFARDCQYLASNATSELKMAAALGLPTTGEKGKERVDYAGVRPQDLADHVAVSASNLRKERAAVRGAQSEETTTANANAAVMIPEAEKGQTFKPATDHGRLTQAASYVMACKGRGSVEEKDDLAIVFVACLALAEQYGIKDLGAHADALAVAGTEVKAS